MESNTPSTDAGGEVTCCRAATRIRKATDRTRLSLTINSYFGDIPIPKRATDQEGSPNKRLAIGTAKKGAFAGVHQRKPVAEGLRRRRTSSLWFRQLRPNCLRQDTGARTYLMRHTHTGSLKAPRQAGEVANSWRRREIKDQQFRKSSNRSYGCKGQEEAASGSYGPSSAKIRKLDDSNREDARCAGHRARRLPRRP